MLAVSAFAATSGDLRLVEAVKSGDRSAADALIAQHADVNASEADGTTALHWAVHQDDLKLVERLIHSGARAEVKKQLRRHASGRSSGDRQYGGSETPAGRRGRREFDERRRPDGAHGDRPNEQRGCRETPDRSRRGRQCSEKWRGQTALMWAAAEGQAPMVKELAAHGADLNARSKVNHWDRQVTAENRAKYLPLGGWTALLFAAREGHARLRQSAGRGGRR